ncbi:hypothetical protein NDU88_005635 [Pleurodeles waltl]|uniref:Uncharacterized protein n=1 Tax=Pleurodeles waltl TaxID=8319 RepID=A0AAV7RMM6_PLEWA|nr:hypothetical protein NDU88_005635 [Pleurodeles waltl]
MTLNTTFMCETESKSGSLELNPLHVTKVAGEHPRACGAAPIVRGEKGEAVGSEQHPVGGATRRAPQAQLTGRGGKKNLRERGTEKRVARMYKQPGWKDEKQVCALKDSETWEPKWDELTGQAQELAVMVSQLEEGMKEVSQLTVVRTALREAYGTPLQQGDEDQEPPDEENFSLGEGKNIEASRIVSTLLVTLGEWDSKGCSKKVGRQDSSQSVGDQQTWSGHKGTEPFGGKGPSISPFHCHVRMER